MRVSSARPSGPRAAGPSRRSGEPLSAFGAEGASAAAPVAAASSLSPVAAPTPIAGVAGLMALQGVTPREAAIGRGGALLDALDEVKLALLEGGDPAPALGRLARETGRERPRQDDAGLAEVLDHIELRAAVELAKRGG